MNTSLEKLCADLNTLVSEVTKLPPDEATRVQNAYQKSNPENKEHFNRELIGNTARFNVHCKRLELGDNADKDQIINITKNLKKEIPFCEKINKALCDGIQEPLNHIESHLEPNSPRPGKR